MKDKLSSLYCKHGRDKSLPRKRRDALLEEIMDSVQVDSELLSKRIVFLFEDIDEDNSRELVKKIVALDLRKKAPIKLYINSVGGYVSCGFAITDAIKYARSKVITTITGEACSMAAYISVHGHERLMTSNSFWMSHDMSTYIDGPFKVVEDRAKYLKKLKDMFFNTLKMKTKLTPKEIRAAIAGELWLDAEECLSKGVVEKVI